MKIHTFPVAARYRYDPALVPVHGSPLWDTKHDRTIPPTTTVRVGNRILTPKQIVYILHQHPLLITEAEPNPVLTMPMYILNRDENPTNILIENLKPADTTRRWGNVVTSSGAFVPKHLLVTMTAEDRARLGIPDEE
jgi:hypothetical protein